LLPSPDSVKIFFAILWNKIKYLLTVRLLCGQGPFSECYAEPVRFVAGDSIGSGGVKCGVRFSREARKARNP
jgi:hypothetical protein